MSKIKKIFKSISVNYRFALLTGVLIGTSYIPFPPWALLFCYLPLWFAVYEMPSMKKVFAQAWVAQFLTSIIGFFWISYLANAYGKLPWAAAIFATILFASFAHLYVPIAALAAWWATKKLKLSKPQSFFVHAMALVFLERYWPGIFPWHLGYPLLWSSLPVFHLADLIGFEGLSALILFLQAILGALYLQKSKDVKWGGVAGVAILILLLNFWGLHKGKYWQQKVKNSDLVLDVGIVQANIGNIDEQYQKYGSAFATRTLQSYIEETNKLLKKQGHFDLLVWPESAMPFNLDDAFLNQNNARFLLSEVQRWNLKLFTGAYSQSTTQISPQGGPLFFNSTFLLGPDGKRLGQYEKTILLVFGEYLPMGAQYPVLYKLFPYTGHFGRGPGPSAINFLHPQRELQIGPQICYESLFPEFTRGLAAKKVDLIINVTNDSWYGPFSEQFQHLYMTLARAIEVRKPLVRSTNTGISTVILADGTILEKSPYGSPWSGAFKVPVLSDTETTFYVKYGHFDLLLWILLTILSVFALKARAD